MADLRSDADTDPDYDVIVVGSGFGGSVTALRLTEKGYRVGVLEAGRRFADHEFPATSWHLRSYLWAPWARCFGIFRANPLRDVLVLSGAGVGGGSLVYANTLYRPPRAFYEDPQWAGVTDWADELDPAYDQAARMLGVSTYPRVSPSDAVMRDVAEEMGVGHTYRAADVGVFFGAPPGEEVPDPFFGGAGPARHGCLHCGECMTGCRHDAKNTLVKNYLFLAEAAGARVHPMTTATAIRPRGGDLSGASGYEVDVRATGRPGGRRTLRAGQVVVAASALGTQRLLHRLRCRGDLPRISPRLGELSRTNSEAILAARTASEAADFTRGVSITSSIHPDDHTHVEPVRYGRGSNLLALLSAVLVDGTSAAHDASLGERGPSLRRIAGELVRSRKTLRALHRPRSWAEQSIVLLVMQTLDNSLTLTPRRFLGGLRSRPGAGTPNPAWIPAGHEVARRVARRMGGFPVGASSTLVNLPVTGHFLGGAVISETPETGVVDPYHRLHGHPGVHVVDGSTVPANLGVNPSLTITALAERAMSLWPNRGGPDPRPAPGEPYRRVAPVAPDRPAVPADAPGALRTDLPTPTFGAHA
ncbi:cholesterol oxidase [Actinomycetospora succinea]|uniref:Cholesterol oxidase n=1 Tax=Actinomycetospora succinea TaxID=663603 RepID=A0A4V6PWQ7_9PSEU|nr:GMC family oxidoreductase [Actinomycetospora succinea]TDQ47927.1 cholesterol oxidase [Actinomycetospora succinea]